MTEQSWILNLPTLLPDHQPLALSFVIIPESQIKFECAICSAYEGSKGECPFFTGRVAVAALE